MIEAAEKPAGSSQDYSSKKPREDFYIHISNAFIIVPVNMSTLIFRRASFVVSLSIYRGHQQLE